jgi:hypothetical protein
MLVFNTQEWQILQMVLPQWGQPYLAASTAAPTPPHNVTSQ